MIDLESLPLKDLKQLQKDVSVAIEQYKERARRKALAEVEAFARERGLTPADLSDISLKRSRKPATPKYANPADPSQTWSGRGRQPRWVVAELANGKTLADMSI